MDKKYQVFISSTYEDLKEERKKVQEAVLSMYQFPIGMEMFSAADEEQWEIIKETIDSSDYYILLVAHRYGSIISEGSDRGISYTEKEYQYAKSKGIPILAFIIDESVAVKPIYMDTEQKKREKLKKFKDEIKTGRIVEWWKNCDELGQKVTVALYKQFNQRKRPGWIRSEVGVLGHSIAELWKTDEKYGIPPGKTHPIPMYLQEDQDTYHFVGDSKEIIFCARTGKGFLNGHYNLLKEFVNNGGKLKFVTTKEINLLYNDKDEHLHNKENSLRFIKNLYEINNQNVECKIVDVPLNITMLYIDTGKGKEFVEIKFVFQTKSNSRHPLIRVDKGSPYFDIFYNEIINIWKNASEINLKED